MDKNTVPPADRGVRVEVPEEVQPLPVNDATAGDEGVDNPPVQPASGSDIPGEIDDDDHSKP